MDTEPEDTFLINAIMHMERVTKPGTINGLQPHLTERCDNKRLIGRGHIPTVEEKLYQPSQVTVNSDLLPRLNVSDRAKDARSKPSLHFVKELWSFPT